MKATYIKFTPNHETGRCMVIDKGTIALPAEGHGIRYRLRQAFPGFEFTYLTTMDKGYDYRMHSKDCRIFIAINLK